MTLTVTVWDSDLHQAHQKAAAVQRVIDGVGLVSKIETVNAVEAWLGSLPGHAYADVRRPVIGSLNLCDLIPLSSVWPGPGRCEHLNGPVLLQAQTKGATPFRLSLFQGDVGHTMVCGPTGAGKSTLLNFLASQWRRYPQAQVYFFDKGGSFKVLTLAAAGDYYDLGATEGGLSFQPLARVHEPPERSGRRNGSSTSWSARASRLIQFSRKSSGVYWNCWAPARCEIGHSAASPISYSTAPPRKLCGATRCKGLTATCWTPIKTN